jgi:hypothetical protein
MSDAEEPSGARTFAASACAALVAGSSTAVTIWWELPGGAEGRALWDCWS